VPNSENVLAVEEDSIRHMAPIAKAHPVDAVIASQGSEKFHLPESLALHLADQTHHRNVSD